MSETTKIVYYALWMMHPVLQAGVAAAMLRHQLHRKFKYFFTYIVAQILTFAVVFPAQHHVTAYFYLYWLSTAISVALGFKVIHEAFVDIFKPFHTLRDLGTVLFKWAGLVMLLVAGVVSVSTNSIETPPWIQAILTAQRCVRIIQIGMVLFLLFFSRYLGMSRRQHSFGICLGFGFFASVELAVIASWSGHHLSELAMSVVNMGAYNLSLMMWLGYMVAKSPARDASASLLQPQRWEQSLTDIQHPLPADSLIPMFEGMVDRALSRTPGAPRAAEREVTLKAGAQAAAAAASVSSLGLTGLRPDPVPKS